MKVEYPQRQISSKVLSAQGYWGSQKSSSSISAGEMITILVILSIICRLFYPNYPNF
jgi:hypothetical protein